MSVATRKKDLERAALFFGADATTPPVISLVAEFLQVRTEERANIVESLTCDLADVLEVPQAAAVLTLVVNAIRRMP